jgi:hypothetical protein
MYYLFSQLLSSNRLELQQLAVRSIWLVRSIKLAVKVFVRMNMEIIMGIDTQGACDYVDHVRNICMGMNKRFDKEIRNVPIRHN